MGKAWKFEDNLNTDEIIPARYNITIIPQELAKNVFCEIKPAYAKTVKPGDVIVGGQNFGCGSSREHAPIAIKGSGAKCIIASSYARIFFRNAINIGLPILECPEAVQVSAREMMWTRIFLQARSPTVQVDRHTRHVRCRILS